VAAPFPNPDKPPTEIEFAARLPLAVGKKLASVRATLCKQRGVSEALYFFGPKTGWAYRFLRGGHSVATVMLHGDRVLGIVSLDQATLARVDFATLSDVARAALRSAHGTPALSWLDIPLEGTGAADFKALVKAKLRSLAEAAGPSGKRGGASPVVAPPRAARQPPPAPPPPPSNTPPGTPAEPVPARAASLSKN
jgi:hypothetical protein